MAAAFSNDIVQRIIAWAENDTEDDGLFRDCMHYGAVTGEATPLLIELLGSGTQDQQQRAAACLQHVYPVTDATDALCRAIHSLDADLSRLAAWALARMCPAPLKAQEALLGVKSCRADVREAVLAGLGNLARSSSESAGKLIEACHDTEPQVRRVAAWWLGRALPDSDQAANALVALLTDEDAGVRAEAAEAIGECYRDRPSSVVDLLIQLLSDSDAIVRDRTQRAIYMIGPDDRQLEAIVRLLDDSNHMEVRIEVAGTLISHFGSRLRNAEQDFFDLLQLPEVAHEIGDDLLMALADMPPSPDRVENLSKLLKDEQLTFRAAQALLEMDLDALHPILEVLQSPDCSQFRDVCQAIAFLDHAMAEASTVAMSHFRSLANVVLPPLIDALCHENADVRDSAAYAIHGLRSFAAPAVEVLGKLLEDPCDSVRLQAIEALGSIGTAAAYSELSKVLDHESSETRCAVARALGYCISVSEVIPALLLMIDDCDAEVQAMALASLCEFGSRALPALDRCRHLLQSDNAWLRMWSSNVIGAIGPDALVAELDLCEACRLPSSEARAAALGALASLHACGESTVGIMAACLSSPDPTERLHALKGFASVKDELSLSEHVLQCKNDWDREVRALANSIADGTACH